MIIFVHVQVLCVHVQVPHLPVVCTHSLPPLTVILKASALLAGRAGADTLPCPPAWALEAVVMPKKIRRILWVFSVLDLVLFYCFMKVFEFQCS